MLKQLRIALVFFLSCWFGSLVQAQASRTWVSGVGDDANPCSRTAPCKTFAGAISKTAAIGIINAIDNGGFGAVTITKSITIDTDDLTGGISNAGTNGIIINAAPTDRIVLRNLLITGSGTGLNGIRILNAGEVLIDRCKISEQSRAGISIENAAPIKVVIRNCQIDRTGPTASNLDAAVVVRGAAGQNADVLIENSQLNALTFGVIVGNTADVIIRDSVITGGTKGLTLQDLGGVRKVWVEHSTISNFAGAGIEAGGVDSLVRVTDSSITDNGIGVVSVAGGVIESFGDNRLFGNSTNGIFNATNAKQ